MRSFSHVQGSQGFLLQLQKDLDIPPSTHLEARFPCHELRAMLCSPSPLKWRLKFPGATQKAPCVPRCYSRETPHVPLQLKTKPTRFPHHLKMRRSFPAWPREQSRVLTQNSTGGLTPFSHSIGCKRYPSQLARRAEFFASTRARPDSLGEV